VILTLMIPIELGEMIEVRLLDWMKAEGDAVAEGDALLEFETDKALVMVTAAQGAYLRRCRVAAGDWMKPGDIVAWLSTEADEPLPDASVAAPGAGDALLVNFDVT
jgi:pyruvate/2-oxoglutarate dehydrogenase complex dihydrolipoamide acyltransferase (E2) component